MKKSIRYMVIAILVGVLAGCRLAGREIQLRSQSEKTGVFSEVTGTELPPKGLVDLSIKASIKTHTEGHYFMEPENTFHGQEGYPVLINIDGQAVTWKLTGQKEINLAEKDKNNPEEGEGIRYKLEKKIRLAPGLHKLFFGLPGEKVYKEINLTLLEGKVNILEFKPRYPFRRGSTSRSFLHGVDGGDMFFNGNPLR